MAGLKPLQVVVYPFLDMSSPHLCDCFKIVREPRYPIILRNVKASGKFTPAFTESVEDCFPIYSIGVILTREIELHFCVWGINWLIGVKVLSFQLVIYHKQCTKRKPSVDHQYHSCQVR